VTREVRNDMREVLPKTTWPTILFLGACLLQIGCGRQEIQVLGSWPLDSLAGLVSQDEELSIDLEDSVDGGGSLHIAAKEKRVVKLFEVRNLEIENVALTYSAWLKCMSVGGNVYLEMWCRVPGRGESFSRGFETAINRSEDWTESQTLFFVDKGYQVDRVRLNLVIEDGGHVWVDDVKLTAGPYPQTVK